MPNILLVQGANMNWLGTREPEKYGTTTAAELDELLRSYAKERAITIEIAYCNHEGDAIERLQEAHRSNVDAIVMNPGGFSYAGYALRDCMLGIKVPVVEVHMTNHYVRNIHSVTGAGAKGVIQGFGIESYYLGIEAALRLLRRP